MQLHSVINPDATKFELLETFILPKELNEISGIDHFSETELIAVQDEKGSVFWIDKNSGKINRKRKFGPKDDYEGILLNKGTIFANNSNGKIWRMDASDSEVILKSIDKKHDFETLIALSDSELVLIDKAPVEKGKNCINSIFLVDLDQQSATQMDNYNLSSENIEKVIGLKLKGGLYPSDATVYKQQYFILSHRHKLILVTNRNFDPIDYIELPEKYLPQPEAICFDNEFLYLASEKVKDKKAVLLKFKILAS